MAEVLSIGFEPSSYHITNRGVAMMIFPDNGDRERSPGRPEDRLKGS